MPNRSQILILVLTAIFLFGLFSPEIYDSDFWWHLRTGRYIVDTHTLPTPDPFAWTTARARDTYPGEARTRQFNLTHEWLAQAMLYAAWRAGGFPGVVAERALSFGMRVLAYDPYVSAERYRELGVDKAESSDDVYGAFNAKLAALTVGIYESPVRHLGGGPDVVAKAIEKAITRRRAPTRMPVTPSARLSILQRRLLPDRLWDAAMRSQFPQPR